MKKKPYLALICRYLPNHIAAVTIYPFIVFKQLSYTTDEVLVNHERIHLRQQLELLLLPFYLWYGMEFLLRFCYLKDKRKAYRSISFEREAYTHEGNLDYLKTRKGYAFLRK